MRNHVCGSSAEIREVITSEILRGGNHTVVLLLPKKLKRLDVVLNELPLAGWGVAYIMTPRYDAYKDIDGVRDYAHSVSITCPYSKRQVRAFWKKLKEVTEPVKLLGSEREKANAIASYISKTVHYDSNCRYRMFAYSALMECRAVCAGYSRLFRSMCAECGIKAICVDGMKDGVPHEWNKVLINGKWHKMDVTFMRS